MQKRTLFFLKRQQFAGDRLYKSLLQVYGLNHIRIDLICKTFGLRKNVKLDKLSTIVLRRINNLVYSNFFLDRKLRRVQQEIISNLVQVGSYRGISRRRGLPVRGQRTRTNANTSAFLNRSEG
jgi:small subunit ribosomal protein S13